MAPFVSKLLLPPPSHAASIWSRRLVPRETAASPNRSLAGRQIAPSPPSRYRARAPCPAPSSVLLHALTNRSPTRRFAPICASASSDRAAGETTAGPAAAEEEETENLDDLPFVQLSSDILQTELSLLKQADDAPPGVGITAVEDGDDEDGRRLSERRETAAYPAAMNALYAACLAGNVTEQLWNFTWPAAIATLHPSLLPVAVLGFFSKLVVFLAGPLVGDLVSSLPLIPAYRALTVIQTAAHLVSAAMVTYAFTAAVPPTPSAASVLLLQPWFAALVASTAVDRLSSVSLGVIAERDFVVQLAGEGRPIALARANAALSRVDLLCETAGASIFAVLLSRSDPVTCVRLSCAISLCALPLVVFLGGAMNRLADGIFDDDRSAASASASPVGPLDRPGGRGRRHGSWSTAVGEEAWETIRRGWTEYLRQPVLPASLAYVLVCFNVALAPGALMTTFLIHHGASAAVLGAFGGSSAAVGILATFVTPYLVKELGTLKAGAAGLVAQSALLGAAVVVFVTGGPISRRGGALFVFLGFIVASRLGHMAYSVIGLQVVQTGNPMGKAKLIGATEIAVASLAELAMMAVAAVAGDAAHFGCLAVLSAASVAAAACLFCAWLANPTVELRRLFPC